MLNSRVILSIAIDPWKPYNPGMNRLSGCYVSVSLDELFYDLAMKLAF